MKRPRRSDYRSEEAAEYRRLYKSPRWKATRARHLADEPLCRFCLARGIINDGSLTNTGARQQDPRRRFLVCDHVEPHKGDVEKFFAGPFQTLCPDDHDIVKQQLEVRGYIVGCDAAGRPLSPDHPWNRRREALSKVPD
jgi:hypothetical protein